MRTARFLSRLALALACFSFGCEHSDECVDPIYCAESEQVVPQVIAHPILPADPVGLDLILIPQIAGDADKDGVAADSDCDDGNPQRYPGATEIECDGLDQNCDEADTCDRDGDLIVDELDCDPDNRRVSTQCHPDRRIREPSRF